MNKKREGERAKVGKKASAARAPMRESEEEKDGKQRRSSRSRFHHGDRYQSINQIYYLSIRTYHRSSRVEVIRKRSRRVITPRSAARARARAGGHANDQRWRNPYLKQADCLVSLDFNKFLPALVVLYI